MGVWIETSRPFIIVTESFVTPYVGVWIETSVGGIPLHGLKVTPYVGVWIETLSSKVWPFSKNVTPYVGVWIETLILITLDQPPMSHPTWVCGLKQKRDKIITVSTSHTLRGCVDWNVLSLSTKSARYVTPYVGVWIETCDYSHFCNPTKKSHPTWVCGLKRCTVVIGTPWCSHTLRGCVDWNWTAYTWKLTLHRSHPTWVCGLKLVYIL